MRTLGLIFPFCLVMLLAACWEEEPKAQTAAPPKVVVAEATSQTVPLFLELTGRTASPNVVSIRPRVDGHIVSRAFREGTDVSEGDTLFVIDQRPYTAELAQQKGERDSSQASLAFANTELARYSALVTDGSLAEEKLQERNAIALEAQGDLDSNQAAVDAAQLNLDYTTVKAPIAGRIGRVYQDVGNLVSANSTDLVELVQIDPLYVYVSPSETQFQSLEKYQADGSDLKVDITLVDGSTHPYSGRLDFFNPTIDPMTGTVTIRAVFPNDDGLLRPGQYSRVQIQLTEQQDQVTVPAEAIGQDQAGFYVFAVGQDNKAELRRVTVDRTYDGRRIVKTGLKAGEKVITQGQQRVRSGMSVDIKPASGSSDTAKSGG